MINAKTVSTALKERLGEDDAIAKDFASIAAFGKTFAMATTPLVAPALIALVVKSAGACLSATTRIIERLSSSESEAVKAFLNSYDRFRVLFYVACQNSYFQALTESVKLKQWEYRTERGQHRAAIDLTRLAKTFEERAAKIEEAEVRFHYSIDPVDRKIPLYDAYSHWLSAALNLVEPSHQERHGFAQEIAIDAKRRLQVSLAAPEPGYEWMRKYLALSVAQETSAQTLSDLAAIGSTLEGWKISSSPDIAARLSERWRTYRELVQSLPDLKESMYNEDFGVSKVFVTPKVRYHRAGLPGGADDPEIATDLGRLLGALVSTRLDGTDLIVLCGGPGSGKSTLCRVVASELAKDDSVHPVFLKLRRCRETTELSSFVEDSLVREGVISRLADLQTLPNVVLILDGFDELVLASKSKLRHFFSVLLDDIHSGPLRKAKVIVSGRDTLFPRGEGLPRGSHVLNMLPFDEQRIACWGEKWRSLHATNTTGTGGTFHPEALLGEGARETKSSPLRQLAAWPLTLHLLAKVHTAGLVDLSSVRERQIEKAYLYRSILRETTARQTEQASGKGRLAPEQMREFLRNLAWSMYARSLDSMSIEDVVPLAKTFFPDYDEGALTELTEVAIVNAPEIQKGEETGFEFVHKSFSEYLVAERLARTVEQVSHRTADIDGNEEWHRNLQEAAKIAADALAVRVIPSEVQEMLEPMLGSFVLFQRGEKVEETVSSDIRLAGLRRVSERFQNLYSEILNGKALNIVIESARHAPLVDSPLEAYANYSVGVALIGAAAGRRRHGEHSGIGIGGRSGIGSPTGEREFCLDPFDGALWRWLMLIHAGGIQIDNELAPRLFHGVKLHSAREDFATGDWALPIKLGLLQKIPEYRPNLAEAVEGHHRSVREVFETMCVMISIVSRKRDLTQPTPFVSSASGAIVPRGGDPQRELLHFLDHALTRIDVAEDELLTALERGGFIAPQARKHTGANRSTDVSTRFRPMLNLPEQVVEEVFDAVIHVFCEHGNDSVPRLLEHLESVTSGKQATVPAKRGVNRGGRKRA